MRDVHLFCYEAKGPNLLLKSRPKQLLRFLLLDIVLGSSDENKLVFVPAKHFLAVPNTCLQGWKHTRGGLLCSTLYPGPSFNCWATS